LRSIGYSTKPELITKALEYSLTDAVRSQDLFFLIASTASTPQGQEITWKFLQNNWNKFLEAIGSSNFLLTRLVAYATQAFKTEEKAKEVEEFFKDRTGLAIERTIQQSLESIRANAASLAKNLADTTAWLKQNY